MADKLLDQYLQWRANTPEMQMANKSCAAICHAPFTSLLFDPKGYVRSCCQSMTHSIGNVTQQTLREIWNGEVNRGMRDKMRANELPQGCLTCQSDIDKGNFEQTFARMFDSFPISDAQPLWPQNMWFMMSNACNLECVQCYGELSSSIRKNRDKLPPLKRVYSNEFFEELREFLPHLRVSLFLGGEAFLSAENFRIWDMMIADGLTTHTHIVTNGTQLNDRVVRVLSALPCTVSISLDGATKETVESIRLNANFDEILGNIRTIQQYSKVELSFCIMPQNYHEFADFLVLAERLGCGATANTVYQPPEYSVSGLPRAQLAKIVAMWESRDAEMRQVLDRHLGLWNLELGRLKGWMDSPDAPAGPTYLTGITSRMNPEPQTGAGPSRHLLTAAPVVPADADTALAMLTEWSNGGMVYQAVLDENDRVSGVEGTFGGLDGSTVNNKALSVVLMLLRERYGEDVNIVSEQFSAVEMDRTMEFINLQREVTTLRWKVLSSSNPASLQKTFLLAVSGRVEKLEPLPTGGYRHALEVTAAPVHRDSEHGSPSLRSSDLIITDTKGDLELALEKAKRQLEDGQWSVASESLQEICEAYENVPEAHILLGRAGASLADWELSARGFAGAVERGAVSHETWAGLGQALARLERLDSARKAYGAASALDPSNARTCSELGLVLLRLGELEPALVQFERAAELGLASAHIERGHVLTLLGREDEAALALRLAGESADKAV